MGRFVSVDPVFDTDDPQSMTGYSYCSADPINCVDRDGRFGWKKFFSKVATVASYASMIPGPIGTIAAGVSAVSYAAAGDWKNAAMMTAGMALAAVGAGAAIVAAKAVRGARAAIGTVKIAAKARKIASKAVKITSKAAKLASKARSKASKAAKAAKRGYQSARNKLSRCHSFAPDTPVLMADGTTKPIAAVAVGDQVQSTDPATGKTSEQPVTALHNNHDTDLVDVTVANDKGQTTVLHTTWHHPFWNETTHQWTDAADLKPGTQLHSTNGSVEHVVAIRTWTGLEWMRDLTVATTHTYYVVAGNTPVLVYNCTVRMRHYTNSAGAQGIMRDGVIKASDQYKVFLLRAKGKLMSARDAERELGIRPGHGRKVLEFDVPKDRIFSRYNPKIGKTEWYAEGNLAVTSIKVVR